MRLVPEMRTRILDEIPGAIGRKWAVTGVAKVQKGFVNPVVEIERTDGTEDHITVMARAHELGHLAVAQDYVDGMPLDVAWDSYVQVPIFENEVEAWLRGIESEFGFAITRRNEVHLILDCLNSYRRDRGATDEQWQDALDLIADYYTGDPADVYDYTPIEPDANEDIPNCQPQVTGPPNPADQDDEDAQPDEDQGDSTPDQGKSEEDGPDSREAEGRPVPASADQSGVFDEGWNTQEVLDDLADGRSVREVAERYRLNPAAVTPLAAAIAGE